MIYEFFYPWSHKYEWASALNVLRYTPFRAIMATITAMLMSFLVAPWFIQKLRGKQISQIIREEGPASHYAKRGTPTMGGALILLSVLLPTMLWADVHNVFVLATAIVTAGYGAVGFIDDRMKLMGKNTRGIEIASIEDLDEAVITSWMQQAAKIPFVTAQQRRLKKGV